MADERAPREQRFERRMSDAEALMWNVEKDPWLNPSGGSLVDARPPARRRPLPRPARRRRRRRAAAARAGDGRPRPVQPAGVGRRSGVRPRLPHPAHRPPRARRRAPAARPRSRRSTRTPTTAPGRCGCSTSSRAWRAAAARWCGRSTTRSPTAPVPAASPRPTSNRPAPMPDPPAVDLDAIVAAAAAERASRATSLGAAARDTVDPHRPPAGRDRPAGARRGGDVGRRPDARPRCRDGGRCAPSASCATSSAVATRRAEGGGSPLWRERSRHRHLEILSFPLADALAAAKRLGGSLNDWFVTGVVNGCIGYHDERGVPLTSLRTSFVVSTRTDRAIGGNAFTPTRLSVPAGPMDPKARFAEISERMRAKRAGVKGQGLLSGLAGVANLLPTSLVTGIARSQAKRPGLRHVEPARLQVAAVHLRRSRRRQLPVRAARRDGVQPHHDVVQRAPRHGPVRRPGRRRRPGRPPRPPRTPPTTN